MHEITARYDLCLAWNWEYDTDFVAMLAAACQSHGLSLLQVTPANTAEIADALANGQISFQAFWDRTSEGDARFIPIVKWAADHCAYRINPHEKASLTWDKSRMHSALIGLGIYTPYTIIIPPYEEEPVLVSSVDLTVLNGRFTIKPAHGGGGEGVIVEATTLSQVLSARQEYPKDTYLLQAHVTPIQLGLRAAWFRVIFSAGRVFVSWWDTNTHVYTPLTTDEETSYHLRPLREITTSIAQFCELDLFSTEVALTADDLFVVVDYVNDQIDLRLQSKAFDGVPDVIVQDIADCLAGLVAARRLQLSADTVS
jgi:hypothetical protein